MHPERGRASRASAWLSACALTVAFTLSASVGEGQQATATEDSLAAGASAPLTSPGSDTLRAPESYGTKRRLLRGASEILAQNVVQNLFGKYIMDEKEGFTIGLNTWEENLNAGMNWDDNSFPTNNFRHPYQGAMYFNAGRANRFGFYQSTMFAFAGSYSWEYFGEAHNPSYNDFINTAVGGVVLGEVMYRLSNMVLDNTATGSGRTWREIGALVINPIQGFNRMFTGEAFEVHANPSDRWPTQWQFELRTGIRSLGEDYDLFETGDIKAMVAFDGTYGDPFERMASPFDHFEIGMQVAFNNRPHGIGQLEVRGLLGGTTVAEKEKAKHILAAYQHFDYIDNEAYTYGGMSFGATFQSRFDTSDNDQIRTAIDANGILLGATKSDYFSITGREYDYGPGLSAKLNVAWRKNGWDFLAFEHMSYYVHSVNGAAADTWSSLNRIKADVPVRQFFAVGAEYLAFISSRFYEDDLADVHTRNPELRVYLAWRAD
jgi:hypothetical protein